MINHKTRNIFSLVAYNEKKSPFIDKVFYEHFDYDVLIKLKNKKVQEINNMCDGNVCLVDKFLNNYENNCFFKNKSYITVKYRPPKRDFYGRVSAIDAISLLYFRRDFRAALAKNLYVDLDVENCHFNLLLFVIKKTKYKNNFPNLEMYCRNREDKINEVISYYFPDVNLNSNKRDDVIYYKKCRNKVKVLFLRLIYLGGETNWKADYQLTFIINPFINNLIKELNEISEIIYKYNCSLKNIAWQVIKDNSHLKSESKNVKAKVMAYFLQNLERLLLEEIYFILTNFTNNKNNKIRKECMVLCYDGLMILKEDYKNMGEDKLLRHIEIKLKDKYDINLVITEKIMDDDFDIYIP